MINLFLGNIDKFKDILFLIFICISIRFILQIFGQQWIKTTAHTSTLVLLPLITYVITNVISGNIALSIGMVGALSIVRFRNPVRSPLELSVYFAAITMGISASVNIKWSIFLFLSILLVVIIFLILQILSNKLFNKEFFNTSFTEGNSLSTLTIVLKKENITLNNSRYLNSKILNDNEIKYTLISSNFEILKKIVDEINLKDQEIISYQLNK
tara:strand:- start:877 stop:1515 length:639 start_codon:yes stop_codon:yes gene_type:complete